MTNNDTINIERTRKIQSAGILKTRAVLLILSENFLGKSYVLNHAITVIGRKDSCNFKINDPLVSSEHCKVTLNEDGHFQLEDLKSTNSTYLNGKILKKPVVLTYGDRIIIGDTIIRFFHEEKFESKSK